MTRIPVQPEWRIASYDRAKLMELASALEVPPLAPAVLDPERDLEREQHHDR